MMEAVVTTGAMRLAKLQPNCHHQQTSTQLLQGECPSCCPTNSVRALKGEKLYLVVIDFKVVLIILSRFVHSV